MYTTLGWELEGRDVIEMGSPDKSRSPSGAPTVESGGPGAAQGSRMVSLHRLHWALLQCWKPPAAKPLFELSMAPARLFFKAVMGLRWEVLRTASEQGIPG